MYRAFFLLLCAQLNYARADEAPASTTVRKVGYIVGGSSTDIRLVPFLVSVRKYNKFACGGSILNKRTIVSAAHCFKRNSKIISTRVVSIQYGVTKIGGYTNVIEAERVIVHEQYTELPSSFDIALVFLVYSMELSDDAQPIRLPDKSPDLTRASVSGWGHKREQGRESEDLMSIQVDIMQYDVCIEQYAKIDIRIPDNMLCAGRIGGGMDACQGDSGGPMEASDELAGIVSFGFGCGSADYFGVYTNVFSMRPWIEYNMNQH